MRTNQFGYLPNLLNLDVEYCKVRRVPALAFSGLSGLRDLEVTTHNSDWSAMVLELEPGLVTNAISVFEKIIDLPGGQINGLSLGQLRFEIIPPVNTIGLSLGPIRGFLS